jgi:hypothetical protein
MTSTRQSRIIRLLVTALVLTGTATIAAASTSEATASTSTACAGITWGSLPKADGFVAYEPQVYTEGNCDVLTLRGGAQLKVVVMGEVKGVRTGRHECYDRLVVDRAPNAQFTASPGQEIANVAGYSTFREVAYGGAFEGYTTIGLGVRTRLPMRSSPCRDPATATGSSSTSPTTGDRLTRRLVTPPCPAGSLDPDPLGDSLGHTQPSGRCSPNSR